jgi:hypothetical protein
MDAYLSESFLTRVRTAYRQAIAASMPARDQWAAIDARRADVHTALLSNGNDALRAIFFDPTTTELYYGVDRLCRSHVRLNDPTEFLSEALTERDPRALCRIPDRSAAAARSGRAVRRRNWSRYGTCGLSRLLGSMDYTTIDLPLGMVAQACFLGRALSPDALWFAGEDDLPREGRIKLLYSIPDGPFDIALNADSITEMPAAVAFNYFHWAAAHTVRLLSINHNLKRFTVAQLATFSAPNKIVLRRPCPVWDGYTEEAFIFKGPGILPYRTRLVAFETFVFAHRVARGITRRIRRIVGQSSEPTAK